MKDKIVAFLMKGMKIEVASAVIVKRGEKILLTKRSGVLVEGGKWGLPGGHVEKWELAEDAAKRELKEETGFSVKNLKFLFVHEEIVRRLNLHAEVFVYSADVVGEGKNGWEVSEMKWFTRKEIEKLDLAFTHKEMLRRYWRMGK